MSKQQPLDKIVLNAEKIPLSGSDLERITEGKAQILKYSDLHQYNTIDDVFGNKEAIIILYLKTSNFGHWCALFKSPWKPETLYFFDSYAYQMDEEIKFADEQLRLHQGEVVPHLTHLVQKSNYYLEQNKFQFQSKQQDINTCGRWASHRVRHLDMTPDEYKTYMAKNKHYTPDFWVSVLTIPS
jgi:hypothetical protein